LRRIDAYGVRSDNYNPIPEAKGAGSLTGKTFAITGTMSQPRDYFKTLIEEAGGKVTDTISAKLTALVCGEGGGGKRDKAAKLQIPVWDENQLRAAAL
jgi:DNA ligase (NAD+)